LKSSWWSRHPLLLRSGGQPTFVWSYPSFPSPVPRQERASTTYDLKAPLVNHNCSLFRSLRTSLLRAHQPFQTYPSRSTLIQEIPSHTIMLRVEILSKVALLVAGMATVSVFTDNRCPLGVPMLIEEAALPDCDCSNFSEGDVMCGSNIGPPLYECSQGTWTIKDECSCGTYVDCKGQTVEAPHSCVFDKADLTRSYCADCPKRGCTDFRA